MSTLKVDTITDSSSGLTTTINGFTPQTSNMAGRNLIINGSFQVWQRGTDTGSIQSNQYYGAADRFRTHGSGGTYQATRQEIADGSESDIGGLRYFHRFAVSVGDNYAGVFHSVENVRIIPSGETATISFYAKGTNPGGGNMDLAVAQNFGTGGSAEATVFNESFTLTSSWQRFTKTFTMPSLSGKTIVDADSNIQIYFQQPAGDTSTNAWTFDLTGVQLEFGSSATPFEHRSYAQELLLCERYFETSYLTGITPGSAPQGSGAVYANTHTTSSYPSAGEVRWRTKKRATPAVAIYNSQTGTTNSVYGHDSGVNTAITAVNAISENGFGVFYASGGGFTAGYRFTYHYTADSEL
jgi:hypothetical protein